MTRAWTPDLAVGVTQIDTQHQEIFRRVNCLLSAMSQGNAAQEITRTLTFLADYVQSHFRAEEALMDQIAYPGAASHKLQHRAFLQRFACLQALFTEQGASPTLVLQLQKEATEWLVGHISKTDKLLGLHLQRRSAA